MAEVLARRTVESSGKDIMVELVSTGDGVYLKAEGCPAMRPSEVSPTFRILSRFSRAGNGEGLMSKGERLLAALGEFA